MITYLKNMEGYKQKDLKSKDFDSVKELFNKAFKRVNMFVDYRTDLVDAEVDDDQEAAKIKELMKIVPNEEEGRIVGIKKASDAVTTVLIDVNDTQSKLVLLENFNENYSKCLRLIEKVTTARGSYYC
ncbi:hypothetical protein Tco_0060214 [Tanacetum coccineum]